jgi:hypothetical protein
MESYQITAWASSSENVVPLAPADRSKGSDRGSVAAWPCRNLCAKSADLESALFQLVAPRAVR